MDNNMNIKQVSLSEFLNHFDESVYDAIRIMANDSQTDGLICFVNEQMDSSNFGHTTAMCFGPTRTYKSLNQVFGRHLYDLPSQREYPRYYWIKNTSKMEE